MLFWGQMLTAAPLVAAAAGAATSAVQLTLSFRSTLVARRLSNRQVFEDALETADLIAVGTMLRDHLGNVPLESLLDDTITQERVFRSLQRLTDLVNQPIPVLTAEQSRAPNEPNKASEAADTASDVESSEGGSAEQESMRATAAMDPSVKPAHVDHLPSDEMRNISDEIRRIADSSYARAKQTSEIWTALAGARRDMEKALLKRIPMRFLGPQIFADQHLKNAMGVFLRTANRAIHGEEVSRDDALRSLVALGFVATKLAELSTKDQAIRVIAEI